MWDRSKRYGYGSTPDARSSAILASRRAFSATRPLPVARLCVVVGVAHESETVAVHLVADTRGAPIRPYDVDRCPPPDRSTWRAAAAVVAIAVLVGGAIVLAAGIDSAATVATPAARVEQPVGDVAVVFDVGDVDRFVVEASDRVARRIGGVASVSRTGSLGMRTITRRGATVHAPPSGYLIPMVYAAMPRGSVGRRDGV